MDTHTTTPSPEATEPYSQVKYSKEYVPLEVITSPIVKKVSGIRRSKRIAEKRAEIRKVNRTSWIHSRVRKLHTFGTGMIGMIFLPAHIQTMPSTSIIDYGTMNFLFSSNEYATYHTQEIRIRN